MSLPATTPEDPECGPADRETHPAAKSQSVALPVCRLLGSSTHALASRLANWFFSSCVSATSVPLQPAFARLEERLARSPLSYSRFPALTWLFLLICLFTNVRLIHLSWYASTDTLTFLSCTDTFWLKDAGCHLNGKLCKPFANSSLRFRCPSRCASVQLLNPRTIGSRTVNYQPLVVGSAPYYRADSFICQAAIHAGLISNAHGGCGIVRMVGEKENFVAGKSKGISSIGFEPSFPSAFEFEQVPGNHQACKDYWDSVLAVNILSTLFFGTVLRPGPAVFFWVLVWTGYWTVVFSTDPKNYPPDLSKSLADFLPYLFVSYALWRAAWKTVLEGFEERPMRFERALCYLPAWWMGALVNLTAGWIPIDRLTPHDIQKKQGGIAAIIILIILISGLIFIQGRSLRQSGHLKPLVKPYGVLVGLLFLLSSIPGYTLRLHHYLTGQSLTLYHHPTHSAINSSIRNPIFYSKAIFFTPLTATSTRLSALIQAFLLGLLQNGIGRWSFASILEPSTSLIGDGAQGTRIPMFLPNMTSWEPSPSPPFDSFALLLDDVLRYVGPMDSLEEIPRAWVPGSVHFFRIAYAARQYDLFGDFSSPVIFVVGNNITVLSGLFMQP